MASATAKRILGETVVTNERILNQVLSHVGTVLQNREIAPLEKIDIIYDYLTQQRREVLGKVKTQ